MAGEEGIHQRIRQGDDWDDEHQAGACDLPELRLGKMFAPEDLPASDGPTVGAEACGKLTDAAWGGSLPHGTDEDDDGTQVDFGPEEPHRRRCDPLAAAVAIAAEAQPEALAFGELHGSAPRLPQVIGGMEASATGTGFLASFLREVLVDREKDRPESGDTRQIVIHGRVLRGCDKHGVHPSGTLIQ